MQAAYAVLAAAPPAAGNSTHSNDTSHNDTHAAHTYVDTAIGPIIGWHTTPTSLLLIIGLSFILGTTIVKIITRMIDQKLHIHKYFPHSAITIIVGVIIGIIIRFSGGSEHTGTVIFNSETYLFFLIPPVIMEAGYSLHSRSFFYSIDLISLYAVVGTIMNTALIGVVLWLISLGKIFSSELAAADILVFASLISAVDPVAVLEIFQDLNVNRTLYSLVFGESLIKDTICIVLFSIFDSIRQANNNVDNPGNVVGLAFGKFFWVTFGGIIVGLSVGFIGTFVTRFATLTSTLEPLIIVSFCFFSYLIGESLIVSGVMSVLVTSIFFGRYASMNISRKSEATLKQTFGALGHTAEEVLFMIIGIALVTHDHYWDYAFILLSLAFIFIFRFLAIFVITAIYNYIFLFRYPAARVSLRDQLIISYSGLRGVIAFVLALLVSVTANSDLSAKQRNAIITTTLMVIIVAIFIQGTTIRWLVLLLRIEVTRERPEEELKNLTGTQMELRAEEFDMALQVKDVDLMIDKLEKLHTFTKNQPSNNEYKEFVQSNMYLMKQMITLMMDPVQDLKNRLIQLNSRLETGYELISDLDVSETRRVKAEKIRRDVFRALSVDSCLQLAKTSGRIQTQMQLVSQLISRTKAKGKYKHKWGKKSREEKKEDGLLVPELESLSNEPLIKSLVKHGVLIRYEQAAPFSIKRSLDGVRGNVQVESLSQLEARMGDHSTSRPSTEVRGRISIDTPRGVTVTAVQTPDNIPSPSLSMIPPPLAPAPILSSLRKPIDAVRRSFERPPIIRYDLSSWCRSEQFFYYLLRLIHEDLYTLWLQKCDRVLTIRECHNNWDEGLGLMKDIRQELINQRNRRRNAIARLHGHHFAERVLTMGTSYVSEAAHLLTGVRWHDDSIMKQKFKFSIYLERFLFKVDLIVRNLHPEEFTLIKAIAKLERYVLMEKQKHLASPTSPKDKNEYEEEYQVRRMLILKRQQTDALQLIHRYQTNPLVNMNRVLGGDRDDSRMFFKEMADPTMGQHQSQIPEPEPVPTQKYAEGVDADVDTKVDYMVERDDIVFQRRMMSRVKTFSSTLDITDSESYLLSTAAPNFNPVSFLNRRKNTSIAKMLASEADDTAAIHIESPFSLMQNNVNLTSLQTVRAPADDRNKNRDYQIGIRDIELLDIKPKLPFVSTQQQTLVIPTITQKKPQTKKEPIKGDVDASSPPPMISVEPSTPRGRNSTGETPAIIIEEINTPSIEEPVAEESPKIVEQPVQEPVVQESVLPSVEEEKPVVVHLKERPPPTDLVQVDEIVPEEETKEVFQYEDSCSDDPAVETQSLVQTEDIVQYKDIESPQSTTDDTM